jgi:hypothetical protein
VHAYAAKAEGRGPETKGTDKEDGWTTT